MLEGLAFILLVFFPFHQKSLSLLNINIFIQDYNNFCYLFSLILFVFISSAVGLL